MKNNPISSRTLERVYRLTRNAADIGLDVGVARYDPESCNDYFIFMLSNGTDVCVIFCMPSGYLYEYFTGFDEDLFERDFYIVKNIRNFLFYLRRNKFTCLTDWTHSPEASDNDNIEF